MRTFSFIGIIALLIAIGLFFTKDFSGNKSPMQTSFSENTGLSFDVSELSALVKNYSADRVAGECDSKGYVRFSTSNATNEFYTDYRYFYMGHKATSNQEIYMEESVKDMKEGVSTLDDDNGIYYTIKNKAQFSAFLDHVNSKKEAFPNLIDSLYYDRMDSIYLYNDCVFINKGFLIDFNGFTIYIRPLKNLMDNANAFLKDQQRKKQEIIKKQEEAKSREADDKKAFIAVNLANAYSEETASIAYKICSVSKGTALKVIRTGKFYYCDFIDEDGKARTGYIQSQDISHEKP